MPSPAEYVPDVTEGVTREGRFAAFGDSFELHLAFVRNVVTHYRTFVEMCERKALETCFSME